MVGKGIILFCLFVGFLLFFRRFQWLETIRQLLKQTKNSMDEAARQRMLQNRKTLISLQSEYSLWTAVERQLQYSGLKRRFPSLTAEKWMACNMLGISMGFFLLQIVMPEWWMAFGAVWLLPGIEMVMIMALKAKALRNVDRNLLKFLDFLGNYSITAGEVTSVFNQINRYLEEPLKSALDECYYEAQTTGDSGLALLSMAERIEHPQFKELARNMEISIRYCADFTTLVHNSRRSVREYLRMCGERKGMLREAAISMLLLLALSGFILLTVDKLIEISIWYILLFTLPGRIAVGILLGICLLFARQIYSINR